MPEVVDAPKQTTRIGKIELPEQFSEGEICFYGDEERSIVVSNTVGQVAYLRGGELIVEKLPADLKLTVNGQERDLGTEVPRVIANLYDLRERLTGTDCVLCGAEMPSEHRDS